jgi:hypothetical protein
MSHNAATRAARAAASRAWLGPTGQVLLALHAVLPCMQYGVHCSFQRLNALQKCSLRCQPPMPCLWKLSLQRSDSSCVWNVTAGHHSKATSEHGQGQLKAWNAVVED